MALIRLILIVLLFMTFQSIFTPEYWALGEEPFITEYDTPTPNSGPIGITMDSEDMIWFAETNVTKIARFNPQDITFKEYDIPLFSNRLEKDGAQIWGMQFDDSGNLWFTEATDAAIWRFDTFSETFERYLLQPSTAFPIQLAFDSAGMLWFTELFGDRLGKLDPSKVENNTMKGITVFPIPTSHAGASGMTFDDNGNLWFAESFSTKIAKFDINNVQFKEYEMPKKVYSLVGITIDKEGRFWITDHGSSSIYQLNTETEDFREYSTSESPFFPVSLPYFIVSDSQGRIWTNEHYGNIIAMMDTDKYILTEYEIPTRDPRFGDICNVLYLIVDRNDNIWFTEWTSHKIGFLNVSLPIPFNIGTTQRRIIMETNRNVNISVILETYGNLDGPVNLYASGTFSTSGRLEGLDAFFEPNELTPEQNVSTLTLKAKSILIPGVYTLMVGGKYRDVNRLVAVELIVSSPRSSPTFFETWFLLLVAIIPLLIAIIYFFIRRIKRRFSIVRKINIT